jgi:ABC-type Fe3+ transport system permease subunit
MLQTQLLNHLPIPCSLQQQQQQQQKVLLLQTSLAIGRSSFLVSFFFFFFSSVEESDTKNPFESFANSMLLATAAAQVCCFCYKILCLILVELGD